MTKWELVTTIPPELEEDGGSMLPGRKWDRKNESGQTTWDELKDLASQGWELVSVTPLNHKGNTTRLLYVFKRPIEES